MLEIILAIAAWKRGWKGWAFLPIAITAALGFMIGIASGGQGGSFENLLPLALVLDGACIVTLIVLIAKPRKASIPLSNDVTSANAYVSSTKEQLSK